MINKRAVYVFKPPGEKEFTGIALDTHIHNGSLRFFDTNRGHEIPGEVTAEDEKGFAFTSTGAMPGEWRFKVMTIEEFRRKYYKQVEGGDTIAAKIRTTDDLYQWYRREFKI